MLESPAVPDTLSFNDRLLHTPAYVGDVLEKMRLLEGVVLSTGLHAGYEATDVSAAFAAVESRLRVILTSDQPDLTITTLRGLHGLVAELQRSAPDHPYAQRLGGHLENAILDAKTHAFLDRLPEPQYRRLYRKAAMTLLREMATIDVPDHAALDDRDAEAFILTLQERARDHAALEPPVARAERPMDCVRSRLQLSVRSRLLRLMQRQEVPTS